jgi:hypothetical protein
MTGYRNRAAKPTAALWLLIVTADAGYAATSAAALLGALAAVAVVALLVFAVRFDPRTR